MILDTSSPAFHKNVFGVNGSPVPELHSSLFLRRTLAHLNDRLGADADNWAIQIYVASSRDQGGAAFRSSGLRDLFVVVADEVDAFRSERIPAGGFLFKAYRSRCENSQIHSFPVGYFDAVGQANYVPFKDRKTINPAIKY